MQETEKFIEAVKKYPCIWNVNIPTHKCRETKDAAWREIIKETSVPDIDAAKDKWKKLKDAFREAINKRKKELRLGKTHKIGRTYKFQHVMKFLIPILENRLNYNGEQIEKSEDILSFTDDEANESHMSSHSEQDAMAYVQVGSEIHEPAPVSSSVPQRKGYKRNHNNEILDFLMEDAQRREAGSKERNSTSQANELDTIDRFFLSMAETTKKLPEPLQLTVKRKVFNAVIEAEELNMKNVYNLNNETFTEELDLKPVVITSYLSDDQT